MRRHLLWYLLRLSLPVTAGAAAVWLLYALCRGGLLTAGDPLAVAIVAAHAAVHGWTMRAQNVGYLRSHGIRRETLATAILATGLLAAALALLPAAILVWSRGRALVQGAWGSAVLPPLAGDEMAIPLAWLAMYVLLVPLTLYAGVRRRLEDSWRQPNGWIMVGGAALAIWLLPIAATAIRWPLGLGVWLWLAGLLALGHTMLRRALREGEEV